MIRLCRLCLVVLILPAAAAADVSTGIDESAQLPYWEWRSEGMSIRWVQRLPDQSRAFFAARQFNAADVERIATSCVFQTIYKNTAAGKSATVIEYDLADWRVRQEDKTQGITLKKTWLAEWQKRNTPTAARIAFEWSLLPTKHRLLAGDYNWGMTTFGLKPGEKFDLQIVWKKDGVSKMATIPDIQCAKDIHPEPEAPFSETPK